MKRFMLAITLVLVAFACRADQFGLRPGASLAEIQKLVHLKKEGEYQYSTVTVPHGHPAFEDYRLVITPEHGLCKLSAWTPMIETNGYGDAIKEKFDELFNGLTTKYGLSKKFDYLRSGSIWDEPNDWTMGLRKKDRTLAAFWTYEAGSDLGSELENIRLQAHAASPSSGIIEVSYEFRNTSECLDWIKQQNNSAL